MNRLGLNDEPPARQRLIVLVQELNGFEVCGKASNGKDALRLAQELKPDVVLLDISKPSTRWYRNRASYESPE